MDVRLGIRCVCLSPGRGRGRKNSDNASTGEHEGRGKGYDIVITSDTFRSAAEKKIKLYPDVKVTRWLLVRVSCFLYFEVCEFPW